MLSDLVVTASRQSTTVNRVPIAITAVSDATLEQTGLRNITELQRLTPSLGISFVGSGYSGDNNYSLRGISANTGSATVGVYLDDVPVQKRVTQGAGFGAAAPKLFDLDRVEVLRGPQGTLYGGSAMGGAIRFITVNPSLVSYSARGRAEVSSINDGGMGYELSAAGGGPIVQDKLGFRTSISYRKLAGFIDQRSRFTGREIAENTNDGEDFAARLAFTWSPVEALRITPAIHWQQEIRNDSDQYLQNMPAFTTPAARYTASGQRCTGTAVCTFSTPAVTYGPYTGFGPYNGANVLTREDGTETAILSPRKEMNFIPSLTIDYDFGKVTFRSITAYLEQHISGFGDNTLKNGLGQITGNTAEVWALRSYYNHQAYINNNRRLSQEFRFSSPANAAPLSWVAGIFYSSGHDHYGALTYSNEAQAIPLLTGASQLSVRRAVSMPGALISDNSTSYSENTISAYGEANYQITEKLQASAGVRVARETLDYTTYTLGTPNGTWVASFAAGNLTDETLTESPVTPKFGLTYQIDDRNMVYGTVAKGYRMGGVNNQFPVANCAADFAALGITNRPATFDSDSVWNYEAGAKMRMLGGRMQLNGSMFYVDWSNIQTVLNYPICGSPYTANVGSATSKGFDLEGQARFGALTFNFAVGYTDAKFADDLFNTGSPTLLVAKGDRLPYVPKVNYSVGARYDFNVGSLPMYVRGDYQYVGISYRTTSPGTLSYNPTIYKASDYDLISLRAGVTVRNVEVSAFVNNLANAKDVTFLFGGGAANPAGVVARYNPTHLTQGLRPREIGLTASFRY